MKRLLLIFLSLSISLISSAQLVKKTDKLHQAQAAACTLQWLEQHQDARETWGKNRGPLVDPIIRAGGGNPADRPEWCGFTQAAANRSCGLPIPARGMQGAAYAWFISDPRPGHFQPNSRLVWFRATNYGSIDSIRVGLKAGFDYGNGIHHVAEVAELGRPVRAGRAPRSLWTWAGNEGKGAAAGLRRSLYPIGAIDALSNWNY